MLTALPRRSYVALRSGYTRDDVSTFRSYGRPDQRLHFIRADSHARKTRSMLETFLNGGQIDFLMIDGDHTCDGVRLREVCTSRGTRQSHRVS
jgi:hypothetical protein